MVAEPLKRRGLSRRAAPLVFVSLVTACLPAIDAAPPAPAFAVPAPPEAVPAPTPSAPADDERAVVLVVIDGVRGEEAFGAAMPQMRAIAETRGAAIGAPGHGAPLSASGPNFVSMPGYVEIFTGRTAEGCTSNDCEGSTSPTLAELAREGAARDEDVAVIASWPSIARAAARDRTRMVVSTGRTVDAGASILEADESTRAPLARGAASAAHPGRGDFRPDRHTGALALAYLRAHRPRFLFVGLGEPDEYAHRGDYAGYVASLRAADGFLGALFATLDAMGDRGARTLVMVTTDHGRGRDYRHHGKTHPESARSWLVAAGAGVRARGMLDAARPRRLADVAPTARAWLGLDADDAPSAGTALDELTIERSLR